jgi:hypothetical protein
MQPYPFVLDFTEACSVIEQQANGGDAVPERKNTHKSVEKTQVTRNKSDFGNCVKRHLCTRQTAPLHNCYVKTAASGLISLFEIYHLDNNKHRRFTSVFSFIILPISE